MTPITPSIRPTSAEEIAAKVIAHVDGHVSRVRAVSWDSPEPTRILIPDWLNYLPSGVRDLVAKDIYKMSGLTPPKQEIATGLSEGLTHIRRGPPCPKAALIARYRAVGWYVRFDREKDAMWIAPAIAEGEEA